MTPEMKTAMVRGAYLAFLAAGGAFFTALGLDLPVMKAFVSAGSAAFVALGWRGAEGVKDARRGGSA